MGREAIEKRMKEIKALLESEEDINLDELETELRGLDDKLKHIEKRERIASEIVLGGHTTEMIEKKEERAAEVDVKETKEYRSAFLKTLLGKSLTEMEKRSITSADSSAGVAIPTETYEVFFDKMVKVAPMLSEITLLRVQGNVNFAVQGNRAAAAKHTENEAVTPSNDTFVKVSLAGFEIMKVLRISQTVKTMSVNAFEDWLTTMLAEDVAEQIENYIINGTGTDEPKGVANAATYTDGTNAVEYTNGGVITYDEVQEAIGYLPARYDKKAKLLCNKKFLFNQLAKIKDDQKRPIFVPNMNQSVPQNVMGYDIIISDKVANGEAYLGDFTKIVGNLSQDVKVESSTESGFLNNSIDFRGTALFDCDVALSDAFIKISEAEAA
ncbi:MAG: phage major capsid protein [Eubacteriales bacterium]